ncbi:MAG: hypothetical protein JNL21_30645 [Myxococcales bacterium]|nr:hypothetical protein [Myxococcales bacterium]
MSRLASILALLVALAGCASSPWSVVRQEPSNPMAGSKMFAVLPVDATPIIEKGKSDKDTLAKHGFSDGSTEMTEVFSSYMQTNASRVGGLVIHHGEHDSVDFVIRPRIAEMDPGLSTTVYSRPSKVVMEVSIEHRDGRVLDVIRVESSTPVEQVKDPAERYKQDLKRITRHVVDYLSFRTQVPDSASL